MTPYEQVQAVYKREPCARSFSWDLILHLEHGYVVNTPECFVMARPVPVVAPNEEIVNPEKSWPFEQCDCWHVYAFAGDVRALMRHVPFVPAWVSFERRNRIRFFDTKKLLKKFNHETQKNTLP